MGPMVFTQRVAHPRVQGPVSIQPDRPTGVGRGTIEAPNWLVVTVVALCGTVVTLQQTLVVTVLPDFPHLLNTTADNASWLVTATLLTGAVSTPIVGRLADMFGKRRLMLACLAMLLVGSVVAGVGGSLGPLVIGRSLQGVGAALIPVGISILRDVLPPERINVAVALMGATLGLGGAVGLLLSGTIYQTLGWHFLFWLAASMAVLLLVAVWLLVPESLVRTGGRFDYLGAVLLSIAVAALLLAISKSGSWGWTSLPTIASFLVAIVVFVALVPYQLRVNDPLVDIRTTTERPVLLANSATFLVGIAMFANLLATVQLLQVPPAAGYGFGLTSTQAGLAMAPSGLATVAMAPVAATIIGRLGPKVTLITGTLLMAGGYAGLIFGMDHPAAGHSLVHRRRDRRLGRLGRDPDPDHALGPDHRDRVGERSQRTGAIDRHGHLQRRRGRPAHRLDHHPRTGSPAVGVGVRERALAGRRGVGGRVADRTAAARSARAGGGPPGRIAARAGRPRRRPGRRRYTGAARRDRRDPPRRRADRLEQSRAGRRLHAGVARRGPIRRGHQCGRLGPAVGAF